MCCHLRCHIDFHPGIETVPAADCREDGLHFESSNVSSDTDARAAAEWEERVTVVSRRGLLPSPRIECQRFVVESRIVVGIPDRDQHLCICGNRVSAEFGAFGCDTWNRMDWQVESERFINYLIEINRAGFTELPIQT